jgi:two-component system phosphate regulon sensor histidine kinase PhoR
LVDPPELPGLWGAVIDRVRRLLRARDQQVAEAGQRMQSFLAAIQASPNGVTLLDEANRITWCNQTAAGHFGFDAHRDQLQLVGNLVRDPDFAAYLSAGDFSHEVVINGRAASSSRLARVSTQLHPYGDGQKLLLSRDVTALEQADTMRRDFVANVSHEIRTPLTVLNGFVETLQTLPLEEEERTRYLALMAQQAQRMQALVNDLLTLSRLEGSPLPGSGDWVPLAALMAQCEEEVRGLAAVMGKDLDLRCMPAPGFEVSGISSEILSAITNLAANAVRYTPSGGTIEFSWRDRGDGRLEFSVQDTGPGIASEHLPRLTERFYRVDRSRSRETGGTGLGLAIVKHVVQRHGGELQIESRLGQGSTFSFWLPAGRFRPVLAASAVPPAAAAAETPPQ